MKCISWNVNGLRACLSKGFMDYFSASDADFFCLQETKMQPGQAEIKDDRYYQYWYSAERKGYSGTAVLTKHEPLSVTYGMGIDLHDHEGRLITLEYPDYYFCTVYTPNSQRELTRLSYRLEWETDFMHYCQELDQKKPIIICGDMNVAHKEIDLKNPKTNTGNAGFTPEEREAMSRLLGCGFTDTFRYLHPNETGRYSWWSYMFKAREKNAGWRIDYFLVSDRLTSRIQSAEIEDTIMGSDHCPVTLSLAD